MAVNKIHVKYIV